MSQHVRSLYCNLKKEKMSILLYLLSIICSMFAMCKSLFLLTHLEKSYVRVQSDCCVIRILYLFSITDEIDLWLICYTKSSPMPMSYLWKSTPFKITYSTTIIITFAYNVMNAIPDQFISDHKSIITLISLKKPAVQRKKNSSEEIKQLTDEEVNMEFCLKNVKIIQHMDEIVHLLEAELSRMLDKLAPDKKLTISERKLNHGSMISSRNNLKQFDLI